MAYRIQANRKYLSFTVHAVANTGDIIVAGNSSVSNVALSGEVLDGAYITQVWAGCPSGANAFWTIKRGANTVAVLDSTGYYDYAGCGNPITLDQTANVSATLTGSAVGYLMFECQKIGEGGTFEPSEYLQN